MPAEPRTCFWPGCEMVAFCACMEHWSRLPNHIRADLNRAIDGMPRGSDTITPGYANAIARARAWVIATFSGNEERRDPGKWERLVRFVRDRDESRVRRRAAVPEPEPAPTPDGKPWRHLRLVRDDE